MTGQTTLLLPGGLKIRVRNIEGIMRLVTHDKPGMAITASSNLHVHAGDTELVIDGIGPNATGPLADTAQHELAGMQMVTLFEGDESLTDRNRMNVPNVCGAPALLVKADPGSHKAQRFGDVTLYVPAGTTVWFKNVSGDMSIISAAGHEINFFQRGSTRFTAA